MNTRDFIYYIVDHGRQLVKRDSHSEFRPETAILSSLMEFPCNFKGSKCAGEKRSPKCCCVNCASTIGHFGSRWSNNLQTLERYASKFTVKNGFWRPGKGCILPRHMRSLTCAFFICERIHPAFSKLNSIDLRDLRRTVGEYTGSHYRYGGKNGTYHKEVIETEANLNKAVADIMLKRKLYYDGFRDGLINVIKRKKNKGGWVTLVLEGGKREVSFTTK